jgi:hypothetical protein
MRSGARVVHLILSWLLVAGLVIQVFLAGLGVFDTSAGFELHRTWGFTLELLPILILIAGLVGGMGRRPAILAIVVFLLFILQSVFVAVRDSAPFVAALHPVNGFLILLLSIWLAVDSWRAWTAARTSGERAGVERA